LPDEQQPITWRYVAQLYPDFVQWVVQTHGPRHTEEVGEEEYTEMRNAYLDRFHT
jgi:hypothetical protein